MRISLRHCSHVRNVVSHHQIRDCEVGSGAMRQMADNQAYEEKNWLV